MRVIFKHEDQAENGEDRGPVTLIEDGENTVRPYRRECVCSNPQVGGELHPNGGKCVNCGDWYRPWYRRTQAEAMAALLGVELED